MSAERVKLKRFNKTVTAPSDIERSENYWTLIGKTGRVVTPPTGTPALQGRVLVVFDDDVKKLGLECHNEVENALWILREDLEFIVDSGKKAAKHPGRGPQPVRRVPQHRPS